MLIYCYIGNKVITYKYNSRNTMEIVSTLSHFSKLTIDQLFGWDSKHEKGMWK